jgi:hypothetical protein
MRFVTSGRSVRAARVAHWVAIAGCAVAALASAAEAQRGGRRFGGFDPSTLGDPNSFYTPPDFKGNPPYDGRFTFARIKYRGFARWAGREGPGWAHDYPDADVHFMTILRELTAMRPFTKLGNMLGGVILSLDDPLLFKYPVAYLSEPGGWVPTAEESKGLRAYIQKGGFLIVDDFPPNDWYTFEAAMKKSFPELNPLEMTGKEPIFDSFFKVDLTRIRRSAYGRGSFYGYYDRNDPKRRLVAIVNYSQDVGDAWQWSGTGFMPVDVSNEAFKLGVNYIIYALTH